MRCNLALMAVLGAFVFSETSSAGPREDFLKLEEELSAAAEAHSDESKAPDSRLSVLSRMDALSDSLDKTPPTCEIRIRTFLWSARLDLDRAQLLKRFERIADCAIHPEIGEAMDMVREVFERDEKPEDWLGVLDRLGRVAELPKNTVSNIRLKQGFLLLRSNKLDDAKKALAKAMEVSTDDDQKALAKGLLFEAEHLQIGMPAPDFAAKTLDGREITMKSLRGKVVLLDFWATWCSPCLAEIPHLKAAHEKFRDKPFVIVGVSLDDVKEILESTIGQRSIPGIQTWDDRGRENPVAEKYNVHDLPQWFLIDAEGNIRARNPFGDALIPAVEKAIVSTK